MAIKILVRGQKPKNAYKYELMSVLLKKPCLSGAVYIPKMILIWDGISAYITKVYIFYHIVGT